MTAILRSTVITVDLREPDIVLDDEHDHCGGHARRDGLHLDATGVQQGERGEWGLKATRGGESRQTRNRQAPRAVRGSRQAEWCWRVLRAGGPMRGVGAGVAHQE